MRNLFVCTMLFMLCAVCVACDDSTDNMTPERQCMESCSAEISFQAWECDNPHCVMDALNRLDGCRQECSCMHGEPSCNSCAYKLARDYLLGGYITTDEFCGAVDACDSADSITLAVAAMFCG